MPEQVTIPRDALERLCEAAERFLDGDRCWESVQEIRDALAAVRAEMERQTRG